MPRVTVRCRHCKKRYLGFPGTDVCFDCWKIKHHCEDCGKRKYRSHPKCFGCHPHPIRKN